MTQKFFVCVLFASIFALGFSLSCLDREGNSVAWFSLIKFPGNVTTSNPRYAYVDSKSGSNYQVIQGSRVDDKGEALPNTIESINKVNILFLNKLLYNDQPPTRDYNPDGGHAKGIIAYDNRTQTGVYIMHSFPKYPNFTTTFDASILYKTPSNTYVYGQNAYCISLNSGTLDKILQNLPVAQPNVYFASGFFKKIDFNSSINYYINQFNLVNGDDQWYLTKNAGYSGYLYEDIIAPYFKTSLAIQTWGRPYQDSRCPPKVTYSTLNINQIQFDKDSTWDHYSDHSKWAITVGQSGLKLACLCDMNRMDSQQRRGGSCLCSANENLYKALSSIIVLTDKCPNTEIITN